MVYNFQATNLKVLLIKYTHLAIEKTVKFYIEKYILQTMNSAIWLLI